MVLNNVAQNFTYYLENGQILEAISHEYSLAVGPLLAPLLMFGVSMVIYMRTEDFMVPAALWAIVGYILQDYMPPEALGVAQSMMVIGLAAFFISVWFGRREIGY